MQAEQQAEGQVCKMYNILKITFKNGNSVKYTTSEWDDWAVQDGFVVIKKEQAWIAIYNTSDIFAVELLQ